MKKYILINVLYIVIISPFSLLLKVYLRFTIYLAVIGTSQIFSKEVPIAPEPPKLEINVPARMNLGEKAQGVIKFKNPLPVKIEDAILIIESDGLLHGNQYM